MSFLAALLGDQRFRLLRGAFGRLFTIVGVFFGLFLAGQTGVLLSVNNQPIWSDTWALGALFPASGLSVPAAVLVPVGNAVVVARERDPGEALPSGPIFQRGSARAAGRIRLQPGDEPPLPGACVALSSGPFVLAGTLVPLGLRGVGHRGGPAILASCLVLVGGLALRIVVIFSAQM